MGGDIEPRSRSLNPPLFDDVRLVRCSRSIESLQQLQSDFIGSSSLSSDQVGVGTSRLVGMLSRPQEVPPTSFDLVLLIPISYIAY